MADHTQALGNPPELGAHYDGHGTHFCVFSSVAERVLLCLFDERGEERQVELQAIGAHRFYTYQAELGPGARYGFRVHGPYDLTTGARCNPAKLLIDPYARLIAGRVTWSPVVLGECIGSGEPVPDERDSAPFVPRSVVAETGFEWGDDQSPRTPWRDTVIYELNVKSFSMRHPAIPREIRGTYAALAHPASIEHFKYLGVSAIELLPIQSFVHDQHLAQIGLTNLWGYSPIGFFAPHQEYAGHGNDAIREFKTMVRAFHRAGLEVILDVAYNHTAEGSRSGPTLSFRGLDNAAYYRLKDGEPAVYDDVTGCGNTLDSCNPAVEKLVLDSLRYWVEDMHVDGFRFDLAAALWRGNEKQPHSRLIEKIVGDPVLAKTKLIAEPWDLGPGGYRLGDFPEPFREWNGKYRDGLRDFWRGQGGALAEFARRISGSRDLFHGSGRSIRSSINFVTCHDGFTLRDLTSYERKYNLENGEENRDGENHNRSWNCGVEGESDDTEIQLLRGRQQRNLLASLFLSQGVPMLLAGDEIGRTQGGNNNAYCQDNEVSWLDWMAADQALLDFTRQLSRLSRAHRSQDWTAHGETRWYRPDGQELDEGDWNTEFAKAVSMTDDRLFVVFNASADNIEFRIPTSLGAAKLRLRVDTASSTARDRVPTSPWIVSAHSLQVWERGG